MFQLSGFYCKTYLRLTPPRFKEGVWSLQASHAVNLEFQMQLLRLTILGGSWDLVSKVISTLIGVISIVTLIITLVPKSHDPLSKVLDLTETQNSQALYKSLKPLNYPKQSMNCPHPRTLSMKIFAVLVKERGWPSRAHRFP